MNEFDISIEGAGGIPLRIKQIFEAVNDTDRAIKGFEIDSKEIKENHLKLSYWSGVKRELEALIQEVDFLKNQLLSIYPELKDREIEEPFNVDFIFLRIDETIQLLKDLLNAVDIRLRTFYPSNSPLTIDSNEAIDYVNANIKELASILPALYKKKLWEKSGQSINWLISIKSLSWFLHKDVEGGFHDWKDLISLFLFNGKKDSSRTLEQSYRDTDNEPRHYKQHIKPLLEKKSTIC